MLPSATLADGLAPVVQTLNSAIHGINHLFSGYVFIKQRIHLHYLLNRDLSNGSALSTFEQLGPVTAETQFQSHITFITAPSFPGKFGLYVKYSCVLSALHCALRNCRPAISPNSQLLVYTVRKAGQDKILE